MRRYWWSEPINQNDERVTIEGEVFKHIFKVCRRTAGDNFELLNANTAFLVQVLDVGKKQALVEIKSSRPIKALKKPHIHLVLSFSQPKVIDKVLEKSVELGVKSLQLISTQNSFLKDQKTFEIKKKRLEKIVTQALQQCGRGESFDLRASNSLEGFLEEFRAKIQTQGYMFYEGNTDTFLRLLEPPKDLKTVEDIYILIGSEGGFTQEESRLAQKSGFKVLSLGDQILRVETACVASISVLKSSFGVW